ncbi:multiheme c-type cytochrome [Rhodospirillum sp. A1_3_36]|uniref:multiheme c-type cytochrome n=1 Tax=Rhodospirillum sp. A1_3_36 TaxID=3391666 RepID=UPI0039A46C17
MVMMAWASRAIGLLVALGVGLTVLEGEAQAAEGRTLSLLQLANLLEDDAGDLLGGGDLLPADPVPEPAAAAPSAAEGDPLGGSLLDDGELLTEDPSSLPSTETLFAEEGTPEDEAPLLSKAAQDHARLFEESDYPSAITCASCHPRQYDEWSVSQHAYAQLSPVMLTMQNAINGLTSTTTGDFCLRCHAPVGSELNEPLTASNLDRHPASREGITCASCHRMSKIFGRINGRIVLESGDIFRPVYGPTGNAGLQKVLDNPETFRVTTSRDEPGRDIHVKVEKFFALTQPEFCGTCHDVSVPNGLRIEEAFSLFKASPAARAGTTCQDCHMGKTQGRAEGYDIGPAATVGGVDTEPRRLTNHFFAGPDYSLIHPGLFPSNVDAAKLKTMGEWLEFDYEAGWGTDAFEDNLPEGYTFPDSWVSIDDRYDAQAIIQDQLAKLEWAKTKRMEVLRNGFDLSDIRVTRADAGGVDFEVDVKNISDGHVNPVGFDAERLFFLQVTVTDGDGAVVFRSGDRDPNGDIRDRHSLYVEEGEVPLDDQVFSLQSKFMARLRNGAEREQVLPAPVALTVAPFIRPEARPSGLYGAFKAIRKHRKGISPLDHRTAAYSVKGEALTGKGPYRVDVALISQALPVNLIGTIQHTGFDYRMTPKDVAEALIKGAVTLRETSAEITLAGE